MNRPLNSSSLNGKKVHDFKLKTAWGHIDCELLLLKEGGAMHRDSVNFRFVVQGEDKEHGITIYCLGESPNEAVQAAETKIAEYLVQTWEDILLVQVNHNPPDAHATTNEEIGASSGVTISYSKWERGMGMDGRYHYRPRGARGTHTEKAPPMKFAEFGTAKRGWHNTVNGHAHFVVPDTQENRDAIDKMIDGMNTLTRQLLTFFQGTVETGVLPSSILKIAAS